MNQLMSLQVTFCDELLVAVVKGADKGSLASLFMVIANIIYVSSEMGLEVACL